MADNPNTGRDARESVFLFASVSMAGADAPIRCRVLNISKLGARLEQAESLHPDDQLTVTIGLAENLDAQVVWARDGRAGIRFAVPADLKLARCRKPVVAALPVSAGWTANLSHPYRAVR